jgi:transcriptional regulator with XRE-family HTH domain
MEKADKSVFQRLGSIRDKLDMNQDEFADYVEIPERTYQSIERGVVKNPGIATIAKIAEKTGVSLDYIYFGKETPTAKSDLIVEVVTNLPSLDEKQLRSVLALISTALDSYTGT